MNSRVILWVIFAIFLLALNVWKWWPESARNYESLRSMNNVISAQQLQINVDYKEKHNASMNGRDIFKPKEPVRKETVVKKQSPQEHVAIKTSEELEREAAEAELSQFHCVGFAIRGGTTQAFLVNNGKNILVSSGDMVGSRFVVEKIEGDGVLLTDKISGVSGMIKMLGK